MDVCLCYLIYLFIYYIFFSKEGFFDEDNDFMLFYYYVDKRINDLVVVIFKIIGENKLICFEILYLLDR